MRRIFCAGFILALLAGCEIPFDIAPSKTTLRLEFDSPAATKQASGSPARLVAPSSDEVSVTVLDADGKLVTKTSATWNASTNSAEVPLEKIPLNKPLTFQVFTYAPNGTSVKDLTGAATASVTLKTGDNSVKMVLVPQYFSEVEYAFGNLDYYEQNPGDWTLRQVEVPEGVANLYVLKPEGATLFLQSPSGTVTALYRPLSAIPAKPGTWNILLWNQSGSYEYGDFEVASASEPDYSSKLTKLHIPDVEADMTFELRLYDRPSGFPNRQLLKSLEFNPKVDGPYVLTVPDWTVSPQMELTVYVVGEDEELELDIVRAAEQANEARELWVYDGTRSAGGGKNIVASHQFHRSGAVIEEGEEVDVLVALDDELPAPQNLSGSVDGSTGYFTWSDLEDSGQSYYELDSSRTGEAGPFYTSSGSVDLDTGANDVAVRAVWEDGVYTYRGPDSALVTLNYSTETEVGTGTAVISFGPLDSIIYSESVQITGTAYSSEYGVPSYPTYTWNGTNMGPVSYFMGMNWTINLSGLQSGGYDGLQQITVTAVDGLGNPTSQTISFFAYPDTTGPNIVIQSPSSTEISLAEVQAVGFDLVAYITDEGGVGAANVLYNDGATSFAPSMTDLGGGVWLIHIPTTLCDVNGAGDYTFTIMAWNLAETSSSLDFTMTVVP